MGTPGSPEVISETRSTMMIESRTVRRRSPHVRVSGRSRTRAICAAAVSSFHGRTRSTGIRLIYNAVLFAAGE